MLPSMGIETPKLKIDFAKGDRIKVTSGPFFDFTGIVDDDQLALRVVLAQKIPDRERDELAPVAGRHDARDEAGRRARAVDERDRIHGAGPNAGTPTTPAYDAALIK